MVSLCKTFDTLVYSVSAVQNAADELMEELHFMNTHVYMLLEDPSHGDIDFLKRKLTNITEQISALSSLAEEPDEALVAFGKEMQRFPASEEDALAGADMASADGAGVTDQAPGTALASA